MIQWQNVCKHRRRAHEDFARVQVEVAVFTDAVGVVDQVEVGKRRRLWLSRRTGRELNVARRLRTKAPLVLPNNSYNIIQFSLLQINNIGISK